MVVGEDVWLGARVILLSGVKIGRGAIVAAGSIVTKDVLPYSINAGVPSRFIRFKWSIEDITKHESLLYPENDRLSKEELEQLYYSKDNN